MAETTLSPEIVKEALRIVYRDARDIYFPLPAQANVMIQAPIQAMFCEKNRKFVTEATIVMKALTILMHWYDLGYWEGVDKWIEHFGPEVVKHLYSQINK